MDKPDFSNQAWGILYACLPAVFFAVIGRIAHYAQMARLPRIGEVAIEACLVFFLGVAAGGIGKTIGMEDGMPLWGFIAMVSFFGPRSINIIICNILRKYDLAKNTSVCDIDFDAPESKTDKEFKKSTRQAEKIFKGEHK